MKHLLRFVLKSIILIVLDIIILCMLWFGVLMHFWEGLTLSARIGSLVFAGILVLLADVFALDIAKVEKVKE